MSFTPVENFGAALRVIDDIWNEMQKSGGWSGDRTGLNQLPDIGISAIAARSAAGRSALDRLAAIDVAALPHDLPYTVEIARQIAERWAREEDWYWLLFDPLGVGFYAMFAPTAYCGGFLLNSLASAFRTFRFDSPGDGDRYVGIVRDYARLVRQMQERTAGQAERDLYMPRPQLAQAVPLIREFRNGAEALLIPSTDRLTTLDADEVLARVARAIADDVMPAFDALLALLESDVYVAAAPEAVGLGQYAGGSKAYDELVRVHTTLDLTPDRVHAIGQERMARIRDDMRSLLDDAGFPGSPAAFLEKIMADTSWRARGTQAVEAVFQRYIDRIAPHMPHYFRLAPAAGHGAAPLPDALTRSMTFGFYSPPTATQEKGLYMFNAPNLSEGPLNHIGALNYHELVPGHHFHLATQDENDTLHPLRRKTFFNAFNEGWAEYAATLAGEMGMYPEPEERFGRLMMDAFLTSRLVVDTGMNAMGWSLEQARDYMRENAFMPETEIRSETIRYSCDIPGQALAYKLGDTVLYEARERMRAALGNRFDIRDFHDAVLKPGAMPLPLVERRIEEETRRLAARTA